jgi:hypothetical protein
MNDVWLNNCFFCSYQVWLLHHVPFPEASMELLMCLHKLCVAFMMTCNFRVCLNCGVAVSGVTSFPLYWMPTQIRLWGVSACMHTIACRGCLLAVAKSLETCTIYYGCMIVHLSFPTSLVHNTVVILKKLICTVKHETPISNWDIYPILWLSVIMS